MKKILIISTSLRKNSNSEILALEAKRGAEESGNIVEFISLKDKEINFCKGCLACQKLGRCVIDDDANDITEKMKDSDVIIWATPIYYYEMSGQMKTLIDRANSLYVSKYNLKEVYLITTSADDSENVVQTVINALNGWLECLPQIKFEGYVCGCGLNDPNDAINNKNILEKAYNLGKNI